MYLEVMFSICSYLSLWPCYFLLLSPAFLHIFCFFLLFSSFFRWVDSSLVALHVHTIHTAYGSSRDVLRWFVPKEKKRKFDVIFNGKRWFWNCRNMLEIWINSIWGMRKSILNRQFSQNGPHLLYMLSRDSQSSSSHKKYNMTLNFKKLFLYMIPPYCLLYHHIHTIHLYISTFHTNFPLNF